MNELIEENGHQLNAVALRERLVTWGREHWRSFPWRYTRDPYRLLMAEFMLLRTQASQVVPVYERFIDQYPDIESLTKAPRSNVQDLLYSLGLKWRADYILDAAVEIKRRFRGEIPDDKEVLLSLPGISQYIASAVLCFAFGRPEPIIDTNTVRVTGRLFGLEVKDSSRRSKRFRHLITAMVDSVRPRVYNFALLDLAALVCTKKKPPDCPACPLQPMCSFGQSRGIIPGQPR